MLHEQLVRNIRHEEFRQSIVQYAERHLETSKQLSICWKISRDIQGIIYIWKDSQRHPEQTKAIWIALYALGKL
jgi:hypothetical protein